MTLAGRDPLLAFTRVMLTVLLGMTLLASAAALLAIPVLLTRDDLGAELAASGIDPAAIPSIALLSGLGAGPPLRLTGCTGSVRAGATDLAGGDCTAGNASVAAFRAAEVDVARDAVDTAGAAGATVTAATSTSSSRRTVRRRTTVGRMRSSTTFCCFSFSMARLTRSASAGSIELM